jgi:putative membrane protein
VGGFGVSDPPRTNGAMSVSGSTLAGPVTDRFPVRVTADSHFAWLRTRASFERTMMSWICMAVSLIGFTIVQFFECMQDIPGVKPALHPAAPRYLGHALIGCDIVALVISVWQYHWTTRYLRCGSFAQLAGMKNERMQTPLYAVTFVLILIGAFAFGAVPLRFV